MHKLDISFPGWIPCCGRKHSRGGCAFKGWRFHLITVAFTFWGRIFCCIKKLNRQQAKTHTFPNETQPNFRETIIRMEIILKPVTSYLSFFFTFPLLILFSFFFHISFKGVFTFLFFISVDLGPSRFGHKFWKDINDILSILILLRCSVGAC